MQEGVNVDGGIQGKGRANGEEGKAISRGDHASADGVPSGIARRDTAGRTVCRSGSKWAV